MKVLIIATLKIEDCEYALGADYQLYKRYVGQFIKEGHADITWTRYNDYYTKNLSYSQMEQLVIHFSKYKKLFILA